MRNRSTSDAAGQAPHDKHDVSGTANGNITGREGPDEAQLRQHIAPASHAVFILKFPMT
jgi:hypothetical protein